VKLIYENAENNFNWFNSVNRFPGATEMKRILTPKNKKATKFLRLLFCFWGVGYEVDLI